MDVDAPVLGPQLVEQALDGCRVRELLGVGRFGETYRVTRGGDEFALKVCHFIPRMPQRLWERELTALQRVDHPNVTRYRKAGHLDIGGRVCLCMECEYIPGGDLGARIAAGELPGRNAELRGLMVGLLRGVAELPELGVLHRDVRPPNVVPRHGDWSRPVLLDFGVAQAMSISPAQQRLSLASRRGDVIDVTAVVFEAGCGHRPQCGAHGHVNRPTGGRRGALRDPRETSDTFDDDVATLVWRLLAGKERRSGAEGALARLGEG